MTLLVPTRRTELSPWRGLRDLDKQMNDLLGGFFAAPECRSGLWSPSVDLRETEEAYELIADLPGLSKEDIELSIEEDVVTLKGERKEETDKKEGGYHRIERHSGTFQRCFHLPSGVEGDKVTAQFENGVLKVNLPKPETAKPKRIAVNVK